MDAEDGARKLLAIDPDKMLAARRVGGESPWELHECVFAGEFAPTKPYDPCTFLAVSTAAAIVAPLTVTAIMFDGPSTASVRPKPGP